MDLEKLLFVRVDAALRIIESDASWDAKRAAEAFLTLVLNQGTKIYRENIEEASRRQLAERN